MTILMADDDPDDRYLTKTAFEENNIACDLQFVEDGSEVWGFLQRSGNRLPNLILLDLNMPQKDGRQVLQELKSDAAYRHIPVVIFTTSKSPEDVRQLYAAGASSFVTKPSSFDKLLEVTKSIGAFWVETAST